jgi:lysophospholipase L1-like esterase
VTERVAEFNRALREAADADGWRFLDANRILLDLSGDPERIRLCQGLARVTDHASFLAGVAATCPSPTAPGYFGSLISYDGVHPSREGQEVVAEALARLLGVD